MVAGQSSGAHAELIDDTAGLKTSYYDLLSVERHATEDE